MSTDKIFQVVRETNHLLQTVGLFLTAEAAREAFKERMKNEITVQLGEDDGLALDAARMLDRDDDDIDALLTVIYRTRFNSTFYVEATTAN